MAIIIGRNAVIASSTDDAAYNDIGKVTSLSMSMTSDIADATTNDSGGYKEGEYADQQLSVDVTVKYDSSNTAQGQVLTEVFTNQSKLYLRIRPEESTGEQEWKALFTIDDLSVDMSTGEVEEMSFTGSSSGTVTVSTQT